MLPVLCQESVVPMALVEARATDKVVAVSLGHLVLGGYGRLRHGNQFTAPGT